MVDVALGLECNSSCVMCTSVRSTDISYVKQYQPTTEEIIAQIDRLQQPDYIALTGGEPTIRDDLFEILEHIFGKFPNTEVALLTNGRRLAYNDYCRRLVESGLKKFIVPIHAHEAELHDFITRSEGSFLQTLKGLKNLSTYDVNIEIRVIIHGINYPFLPEIARLIKREIPRADRIVLLYFDAIGSGAINKDRLFVKMGWVVPYLERAIDELKGYDVKVYHFPSCVLGEEYRKYSMGKTVEEARITFAEECGMCVLKESCSGVWKSYANRFGMEEFRAIIPSAPKVIKDKKRVVLVWPFNSKSAKDEPYAPPLGITYIAKVLEKAGFQPIIIDANLIYSNDEFLNNPDESLLKIVKLVEDSTPDVVGIGTWSGSMPFVAEFSRLIKSRNPSIPLILGGTTPTALPEKTMRLIKEVDYVVRGEGEETTLELVNYILRSEGKINKIRGVSYRAGKNLVNNPDSEVIKNLDSLPLIDFEDYIGINKIRLKQLPIMTSRGCSFNCVYCSSCAMWGKQRFFCNEYLIKQINHLKRLYDTDFISFNDDQFLSNPTKAKELVTQLYEKYPSVRWSFLSRIEHLNEELIQFLKKKGATIVLIGVESVVERTLLYIGKTNRPKEYLGRVKEILDLLEKNQLKAKISMLYGFPDEGREEMREELEYHKKINLKYVNISSNISPVFVFPGTELWKRYERGEIRLEKLPDDKLNAPVPEVFKEKYGYLPWMVPTRYLIRNKRLGNVGFGSS